jgi:hypothetical protein
MWMLRLKLGSRSRLCRARRLGTVFVVEAVVAVVMLVVVMI